MRLGPTNKRRYDGDPMRRVIGRGLVMVALLAGLTYLAVSAYNGVPGKTYRYVDASVPEVGNLIVHDPIRVAGKRVGQVNSIEPGERGAAVIRMQLDEATTLPEDTDISLRANGLLGARFVELIPGSSDTPLGEKTIRGSADTLTFGVTEAVDVFDRETRGGLRNTLAELGTGVLGQGAEVNDAFRLGGDAIVPFQRLMRRITAQTGAAGRLLPSLNSAVAPLDTSRRTLNRVPGEATAALAPIDERDAAVRDTLSEAPGSLAAANSGLARGRRLLSEVRSLAAVSDDTLSRAPAGLREAVDLLREAPEPLERAQSLLRSAVPAVPDALRITSAAEPLLRPLREGFDDLEPMLREIAPYECDIKNFGAVFRSMTGFGGEAEGPNGPAMEFRLQIAPPIPTEALSVKDTTGLLKREGYPPPCKYLAKPYPAVDLGSIFGRSEQ